MSSFKESFERTLVGICAYNEEYNIEKLLENLFKTQNLPKNSEILVICSGCTDKTPQIVRDFCQKDERIRLVIEKLRKGKANALNKIFKHAKEIADILILVNADTLPKHGSIEKLIYKLRNKQIGAVFARPVPLNKIYSISNGIVQIIWKLHHSISFHRNTKLSAELCAIRTECLRKIPENIATDEPYIEQSIQKQGYLIFYVPEAIVYIRGPTSMTDLLKQRIRIWIGHLQIQKATGVVVATSNLKNTIWALTTLEPREIPFALLGAILESFAFLLARLKFSKGKIPHIWEPIKSTKTSI